MKKYVFGKNLVRLNDVLAKTELRGRYWLWGGVLLGWARENRILPHDTDVDLGYFSQHRACFESAVDSLAEAGFLLEHASVNNAGNVTTYRFSKDGLPFDFFETEKGTDSVRYWLHSIKQKLEMISVLPWNGLTTIEFLGRIWQVPAEYETYLTAVYGNWRIPDLNYDYTRDDKSIVSAYPWVDPGGRIVYRQPVWLWLR